MSDGARPTLFQKRMKWELLLCWGISFPGLMWSSPVFLTRRLRRDCIRKNVSFEMKKGLFLSTSAAAMPSTRTRLRKLFKADILPALLLMWQRLNRFLNQILVGSTEPSCDAARKRRVPCPIDVGCNHCHKLPQPCAFHQGGTPRKYCRQGDGLSQIDAIFWDFPAKLRTNP